MKHTNLSLPSFHHLKVRQNNFRPKCIYVAVMLRRMMEAILNKDAMDDKVIELWIVWRLFIINHVIVFILLE